MMNEKKNIVLDSIKFGFRALYEHIFLFAMVVLVCIGMVFLVLFGSCFVYLLLRHVLSELQMSLITAFFMLFGTILGIFFVVGLLLGFNKIALELYDYGYSSMRELFSCMRLAPRVFGAGVIYFAAVFAGLILFVFPGIFIAIRFSLFSYFIIDQKVGLIQSLKMSYEVTRKHGGQLVALFIILSIISGVLTLCVRFALLIGVPILLFNFIKGVGTILATPFSALVYTYFYRTLVPRETNVL